MGLGDKMKHKTDEAKGRAKEATGDAKGDEQMKAEGKDEQRKSDMKQAGQKAKDAFKR